jgi:hypothetical protein
VAVVKIAIAAALCALLSLPAAAPAATPKPRTAKTVVVQKVKGNVLVTKRGSTRARSLTKPQAVPVGSTINAKGGRVKLTSTHNRSGSKLQSAVFYDGEFTVSQKSAASPVTDLTLTGGDFSDCAAVMRRTGVFTAARTARRRLWGSGKGRFRTRGRNGSATVRGTTWLTEDGCQGTEALVRKGDVQARADQGLQYDLDQPNESVVFSCNVDGVPGVSQLYCLAALSQRSDAVDGFVYGFGIATFGTPQNEYDLCMQRPDGTSKCETYPFDTSDPELKSAGVGCFPAQTGTYVASWRIGGQVLPGVLPFDAQAFSTPLCVSVPERAGDDPNSPPPGPTGKRLRQARAAAEVGG